MALGWLTLATAVREIAHHTGATADAVYLRDSNVYVSCSGWAPGGWPNRRRNALAKCV
jgi:hypothetical protein